MQTPGPWKWDAEGTRGFPVLYGGEDGGTAVLGLPGDRSYLNIESDDAKLIASAPDLARRLSEVKACIERKRDTAKSVLNNEAFGCAGSVMGTLNDILRECFGT